MTTNGSLLNQEIVDFIKSNDFIFKLSHDGPLNFLRSSDVLENKKLNKYIHEIYENKIDNNQFYFNCVYTNSKIKISEIIDYFLNRFDDRMRIMKIEPVIPYTDWAKEFNINLDLEEFSNNLEHELMTSDIMNYVEEYQALYNFLIYAYENENYQYNPYEIKCLATQNSTISLTLDGIITACQVYDGNSAGVLGSIDKFDNLLEQPPFLPISKKRCRNCPVISLCRGTCAYFNPKDESELLNCKTRFYTYKALLKAFFFKYLNLYIFDLDGNYFYKHLKW